MECLGLVDLVSGPPNTRHGDRPPADRASPPNHLQTHPNQPTTHNPQQLMELLRQHPFRAYPVVTHDQEFLGLVKRTTLLRHLGAS